MPTGQKILLRGSVDRVDILKKGEENYIRIIDYKTGSKEFKLSDILYGLNLQMLIYLYAITLGGEERYGQLLFPCWEQYQRHLKPNHRMPKESQNG